ncbi:MAG: hypothetical protein U9Q92_02550 [archaeon]|nr:hypothetical protein [archaeon]
MSGTSSHRKPLTINGIPGSLYSAVGGYGLAEKTRDAPIVTSENYMSNPAFITLRNVLNKGIQTDKTEALLSGYKEIAGLESLGDKFAADDDDLAEAVSSVVSDVLRNVERPEKENGFGFLCYLAELFSPVYVLRQEGFDVADIMTRVDNFDLKASDLDKLQEIIGRDCLFKNKPEEVYPLIVALELLDSYNIGSADLCKRKFVKNYYLEHLARLEYAVDDLISDGKQEMSGLDRYQREKLWGSVEKLQEAEGVKGVVSKHLPEYVPPEYTGEKGRSAMYDVVEETIKAEVKGRRGRFGTAGVPIRGLGGEIRIPSAKVGEEYKLEIKILPNYGSTGFFTVEECRKSKAAKFK